MTKHLCAKLLPFFLFVAPSATALDPCTDRQVANAFLIYVDPVTFASAKSNEQLFGDRLRIAVEANVKELQQKLLEDRRLLPSMPSVVVVQCDPRRAPHQSGDFDRGELQSLDESRVVLELWGLIVDSSTGRGQLGYALVSTTKQKVADPAIYTVDQVLGPDPQTILKAFSKSLELQAYATIAVGTRLYQNSQFLQAAGYLCRGAVTLRSAVVKRQLQHADAMFITQQKDLLTGTLALRSKALQRLGAGPPVESACPVEKVQ